LDVVRNVRYFYYRVIDICCSFGNLAPSAGKFFKR
jgi:hypothetical protein